MIKRSAYLLLIGVLGIHLLSLLSGQEKGRHRFGSDPSPGSVLSFPLKFAGAAQEVLDKNFIFRTYRWRKLTGEEVKAWFEMDLEVIKREMARFGISQKLTHPRYLKKQGFKNQQGTLVIDYPEIFRRHLEYFPPLTASLLKFAGLKDTRDPLPECLNFVQQVQYREPPKYWQGRYIREFFPPLQCLYQKYGDCDTKCVLLAEFLATYPESREKLMLVVLKGYGIFHTLLAVKRKPLVGMLSLNLYGRGIFIPLETTARGWLPGFVGSRSRNCLLKGFMRFEPLN